MEVKLESILSRENLLIAYNQVVGNKGAPGIDGMEVGELSDYLSSNWTSIQSTGKVTGEIQVEIKTTHKAFVVSES